MELLKNFNFIEDSSITNMFLNGKTTKVNVFSIRQRFYHLIYGLNYSEVKKALRKDLDDLIRALQLYLQNYILNDEKQVAAIKQIKDINPKYIISFNYTDTYKVYVIKRKWVILHLKI